jgi:hypothetical protein
MAYALLYKESTGGGEDRREVLISEKFSFGIWQRGRSAGRFDLTKFGRELLMETERGEKEGVREEEGEEKILLRTFSTNACGMTARLLGMHITKR